MKHIRLIMLLLCAGPIYGPTATAQSGPLYVEFSENLPPKPGQYGYSMDARPIDVEGDGDLDLLIAYEFLPNLLLLNDGSGNFTDASAERLPQNPHDSEDIGVADFDGDGDLDVVVVTEDDQVNELYINDGAGFFTDETAQRLPVTGVSNAVLVTDLNGDGAPDILIGNNGQNVA
ncbi:MAG: VCBS repeat-containing protein, partial [Chloroflexi bacterium]|nr:VCBS repeat-containing protein [Chloroflexota bacterium]